MFLLLWLGCLLNVLGRLSHFWNHVVVVTSFATRLSTVHSSPWIIHFTFPVSCSNLSLLLLLRWFIIIISWGSIATSSFLWRKFYLNFSHLLISWLIHFTSSWWESNCILSVWIIHVILGNWRFSLLHSIISFWRWSPNWLIIPL